MTDHHPAGDELDLAVGNYVPLTPAQSEKRFRRCSDRLLHAIDEHAVALEEEAAAKAAYDEAYLSAYVRIQMENEAWPQSRIKPHAEYEALELRRTHYATAAKRKALAEEMHSLRQILFNLQANAKMMGYEVR